jgi:hypothetical protein
LPRHRPRNDVCHEGTPHHRQQARRLVESIEMAAMPSQEKQHIVAYPPLELSECAFGPMSAPDENLHHMASRDVPGGGGPAMDAHQSKGGGRGVEQADSEQLDRQVVVIRPFLIFIRESMNHYHVHGSMYLKTGFDAHSDQRPAS